MSFSENESFLISDDNIDVPQPTPGLKNEIDVPQPITGQGKASKPTIVVVGTSLVGFYIGIILFLILYAVFRAYSDTGVHLYGCKKNLSVGEFWVHNFWNSLSFGVYGFYRYSKNSSLKFNEKSENAIVE